MSEMKTRLQQVAERTQLRSERQAIAQEMNEMTASDQWNAAKEKRFAEL